MPLPVGAVPEHARPPGGSIIQTSAIDGPRILKTHTFLIASETPVFDQGFEGGFWQILLI